jgi:hypothetical protein
MFRDLKEYQDIAKIYAEKVSKPAEAKSDDLVENQENRKKLQLQRQKQNAGRVEKQFGFLKTKPSSEFQGRISRSSQNMRGKTKPEVQTQTQTPTPTQTTPQETKPEIKKPEPKPLTNREKFNAKYIKKDKGKGFVKRGTPMAQRAENKEKAKLKAQALAKARIAAKKKEGDKPTTTPIGKPMPSNVPGGVSGKGKETDDFSKDPRYQSTAGKSTDVKKKQTSNTSAMNVSSTKTNNNKSENPRIQNFKKKVQDLKTTAKYGSTATIQTQDGKEYKPGDPGYEAELKKAKSMVQKSMQRNSYEPDMDAYDMVLEYLLSTEQAATIEEANYVMTEMDAETIQAIVKEGSMDVPPDVKAAAKRQYKAGSPGAEPYTVDDKKTIINYYKNKKGKV